MTTSTINPDEFDQLILQRLPELMRQNPQIQELILELAQQTFADHRQETSDKFYQILAEIRQDRETRARQWEEYTQTHDQEWQEYTQTHDQKWEAYIQVQDQKWGAYLQVQDQKWGAYIQVQDQKWEKSTQAQNQKWAEYMEAQEKKWEDYIQEQERKWEEQDYQWEDAKREFQQMHEAIMAIAQKQYHTTEVLGARCGMQAESSFRNALASILEKSFGVTVLSINEYDDEGLVFGQPDQVDLEVIINNGLLMVCEIKSSMSRSDIYTFDRKVRFYEKRHQQSVTRKLVISPMIDPKAQAVANRLGIEIYTDSVEVKTL